MQTPKPKNRKTEVFAIFLRKKRKWLSHVDVAMVLQNINSHKYITWLKEDGIRFEERLIHFSNRFGRKSTFKQFRIKTNCQICLKTYRKLNKIKSDW